MKSLISLGTALLAAVVLSGCAAEGQKPNIAKIRSFNAVFESGALRVSDGADLATQLGYGGSSTYTETNSGAKTFEVLAAGGTKLFDTTATLAPEAKQLFIVAGAPGNYLGLLYDDKVNEPADNRVRVRFIHAAIGIGAFDVYATQPTEDIASLTPTLASISYRGSSGFFELASGTYKLRFTVSGTKEVIYESDSITLASKESATFVTYPTDSGRLVNVAQLQQTETGGSVVLTSKVARFKLANGIAATPVNVLVDGTQRLAGVAAQGLAAYQSVASGSRQVRVEAVATPGTALASLTFDAQPAREYTLIATGGAGGAAVAAVADKTQALNSAKIRLRVINAVSGGVPVDLQINTTVSAGNIAVASASPFVELDQGTFNITVKNTSDSTVVFNIPQQVFGADHVGKAFAIVLTGTGATVQGVLTADN